METLHSLSFLKITAGQNRRQSRAHQKGRFPPRGWGAAKPPARWTGTTPALRPLLWAEEPFGNPSAPSAPWLKRRGVVPAAVASRGSG